MLQICSIIVFLEGDCSILLGRLNFKDIDLSPLGGITCVIRELIASSSCIGVVPVKGCQNCVADMLAKSAYLLDHRRSWSRKLLPYLYILTFVQMLVNI